MTPSSCQRIGQSQGNTGVDTERVPQDQSQFGNLFPLLAQLEQSTLTRLRVHHLGDPLEYAAVLVTNGTVT
jgi:hypothetical protein